MRGRERESESNAVCFESEHRTLQIRLPLISHAAGSSWERIGLIGGFDMSEVSVSVKNVCM